MNDVYTEQPRETGRIVITVLADDGSLRIIEGRGSVDLREVAVDLRHLEDEPFVSRQEWATQPTRQDAHVMFDEDGCRLFVGDKRGVVRDAAEPAPEPEPITRARWDEEHEYAYEQAREHGADKFNADHFATRQTTEIYGPRPAEPEPELPPAQRPALDYQLRSLGIVLTGGGVKARDRRLRILGGLIGRDLESSKELTAGEADEILQNLRNLASAGQLAELLDQNWPA